MKPYKISPASKHDENGSVLLLAIFIMFAITIIGMIASKSTIVESVIVKNQKVIDEEIANTEAALNLAIRNFRDLPDGPPFPESGLEEGTDITTILNDQMYPNHENAIYINYSELTFPDTAPALPVALIEIRRIVPGEVTTKLSKNANTVPTNVSHRYYAGSIDRKRFAVTVTAYKKNSTTLSSTWIQKGVDLPAEQDSDISVE